MSNRVSLAGWTLTPWTQSLIDERAFQRVMEEVISEYLTNPRAWLRADGLEVSFGEDCMDNLIIPWDKVAIEGRAKIMKILGEVVDVNE